MIKKVVVFDIDDTLTKEIDFLMSGYRRISELVQNRFGLDPEPVYRNMLDWYRAGENTFEKLNESYGLDNPISDYLNVYRYHQPQIALSEDARTALNALRAAGVEMGIVSDGRKETQMNKVGALDLRDWIADSCIIINSNKDEFKPNPLGYDKIMLAMFEKTGSGAGDLEFIYVGDNLNKDFVCPNRKNWDTVCLLDDGRNIHKQDFSLPDEYLPKYKINSLSELLNLI